MSPAMTANVTVPTIDLFPTIDLDTLVAEAAMLTRIDRKYVLTTSDLAATLAGLHDASDRVRVLQINGATEFGYRSVYLDTPDLLSFHSTGQGRRRRFKVRSRAYLDTATSFLEVKTRGPRGTTVKERIEHPEVFSGLTGPGRSFLTDRLAAASVTGIDVTTLTPTLVSEYRRTTLHINGGDGATRATIDTGLRWRTAGRLAGAGWVADDLVIVETKAGATPGIVDRLLWSQGHRPQTISKYGTGMAALLPQLPARKWNRILARELDGSPSAA